MARPIVFQEVKTMRQAIIGQKSRNCQRAYNNFIQILNRILLRSFTVQFLVKKQFLYKEFDEKS